MTKIPTPPQPALIMEIAHELLPPGMELLVVDPAKPEFYDAAGDADYYLGSPRLGIGNEFFRAAPKLKLVQLTSAGYDRVDIEAARKAGVPVANNGGANSVAVAEHAIMLMLAVIARIAQRTVVSDSALSVLVPVLEELVGWDAVRIRQLFASHGLVLQEWDKARTDWVTLREYPTLAS